MERHLEVNNFLNLILKHLKNLIKLAITTNEWNQYIIVYTSYHDIKAYKNGIEITASGIVNGIPSGTTTIETTARGASYLGKSSYNTDGYFDGAIE